MKKLYLFLLFILFIPITAYATECETKPIYHITFNTNSSNNISKISITDEINLPVPVKDKYKFIGWYYDEELTKEAIITKNSDIDSNYYVKISNTECEEYYELKLYAKWENVCTDEMVTHHIIYVTNTDEKISKLSIPKDKTEEVHLKIPTREGYNFLGWYYDKDFKNKVDIKTYDDINNEYYTKVSSTECNNFYEMKIYAKWNKIVTSNSNSNNNSNINSDNNENVEDSNSNNTEASSIKSSNDSNEIVKVNIVKKKNYNVIIYITILVVIIGGIVGFIIYKKRK